MFHKFFCLTEMIQTFCFFVLLLNWSIHMHFFVTYHFRFTYHSVLCNIPSQTSPSTNVEKCICGRKTTETSVSISCDLYVLWYLVCLTLKDPVIKLEKSVWWKCQKTLKQLIEFFFFSIWAMNHKYPDFIRAFLCKICE